MVRIDVYKYIDQLKGLSGVKNETDLYSLKRELLDLSESSKTFNEFEKESMSIGKDLLEQVTGLGHLVKIRKLSSELGNKREINEKLHTLHFNLILMKNAFAANDINSLKKAAGVFLHRKDSNIDNVINELNDFKSKLDQLKIHRSNLLKNSLENKIGLGNKYARHMEKQHSIHERQKCALISTVRLFVKLTREHICSLQKFKNK